MTQGWVQGRGPNETETAWNRRNALALLPLSMPRHCCACLRFCFHTGSPVYCAEHARCTCANQCQKCGRRL